MAGETQAKKAGRGIIAAVEFPDQQGMILPQGKGEPAAIAAEG
jgi:hypothetical protein